MKEVYFVQKVRESVHFDHVLDVLLLAQTFQCNLELSMLAGPSLDPLRSTEARLTTAAQAC